MTDLMPHQPHRPLLWPAIVLDLREFLSETPAPIYIVGGAVRDALLHRPLKDIDLTTPDHAIKLARRIANHFKGDFFVLDDERDVGRALISTPEGLLVVDVARLRGDSLLHDLTDRDFALNAMAVDLHGDISQVIDPLNGEADIRVKQLRRCADHALTTDPIRALRAVRQSVQLGFRIEAETLRDIKRVSPRLAQASPERVRDELFKLIDLPRPAAALRIADTTSVLKVIMPELEPLHGLNQGKHHAFDAWEHTLAVVENLAAIIAAISYTRTDNTAASFALGMMVIQLDRYRAQLNTHLNTVWPNDRTHRALLMLAALLHDIGKPATATVDAAGDQRFFGHAGVGAALAGERLAALRLSNDERARIVTLVQEHMGRVFWDELTPLGVHRFWRGLGNAGVDVCLLVLADYLGARGLRLDQDEWLRLIDRVCALLDAYYLHHDQFVVPPILIDGKQLMEALGLKSGPVIGQLLTLIREAQVTGSVQSAEDALHLARAHFKGTMY
jgi:putative nucleotidyltransferase with HDIG domain